MLVCVVWLGSCMWMTRYIGAGSTARNCSRFSEACSGCYDADPGAVSAFGADKMHLSVKR